MNLKRILLLIFFGLLWGHYAKAQNQIPKPYLRAQADLAKSYPRIIKINLLSPLALTANGAFEQFISSNSSVQAGFYYRNFYFKRNPLPWITYPIAHYRSYGFSPEYRFYLDSPGRPKLNGWFIGPFFQFSHSLIRHGTRNDPAPDGNATYYKARLAKFKVGALAGYKIILNQRLSLELFAGPSVRILHWYNANNSFYKEKDFLLFPISVRSGITLGYIFL